MFVHEASWGWSERRTSFPLHEPKPGQAEWLPPRGSSPRAAVLHLLPGLRSPAFPRKAARVLSSQVLCPARAAFRPIRPHVFRLPTFPTRPGDSCQTGKGKTRSASPSPREGGPPGTWLSEAPVHVSAFLDHSSSCCSVLPAAPGNRDLITGGLHDLVVFASLASVQGQG